MQHWQAVLGVKFSVFVEIATASEIKERIKITDIETAYLPKTDQEALKEGIKVYSEQKLNKLIEDFE